MSMAPGRLLSGRYELVERIAVGGMGEVWHATDTVLGRSVAVKTLKPEYSDDPEFTARFQAEARHTAGLSHPGIASVFDFGDADGTPFLVMELVDGEPLSVLLRREGRLSAEDTLTIVGQAATALHAAHTAGVVHRDVKPGNILVSADRSVKVTDFGIARAIDTVPVTRAGTVLGTAHYLSPEQGQGGDVTPASDVYSLGVVTYECLAGRRPFDGDNAVSIAMAHITDEPPALPDDVPESARMLVEQAMAKSPTERFANAGAFARAAALLQERLAGTITEPLAAAVSAPTMVLPVGGGPAMTVAEAPLPDAGARRRPGGLAIATIAIAVLLVVVAVAVALGRETPRPAQPLPALAGRPQAAALDALAAIDVVGEVREQSSRTVGKGLVIGTEPGAGALVRKGDEVVVLVSTGPKPVALPGGLIGRSYDEVAATLQALGLRVTRADRRSERAAGTVLEVNPVGTLLEGGSVQVVVSSGPGDDGKGKGKGNKDEDEDDD